uniref:Uncharacterized protein n=1 Tax=Tanacetum cinerariifolium TaxID=118510 RepID=A0A699GTA0_TANCI|nr:hypothetical protein [Tanacetum cinerariifolium]
MLNPSPNAGIDSLSETTPWVDVQALTTVAPLTLTAPTLPPPTILTISQVPQAPTAPTIVPSTFLQDLPNFGSLFRFDHHLKTLEANFSEFVQTNQFTEAVSSMPRIVKRYINQRMNEAVKATTDQLDWNNPRGQQYPHNLLKPLPLIPNSRGHRVIPFDHFINNDLEYLRGGASSRKYTNFVTKTKAADYGHIKWIEDLVPRTMWSQEPIGYDKYALWESLIGGANVNSSTDLQSTGSQLEIDDDKLHKFKEGHFKRLHIQDIKDMLLLLVYGKLANLTVEERFAFNVSLRMFTRSIVIIRRVEDLQLGVEIHQKKLNLTKPDTYRSDLKRKEAYIAYSNPRGFIYQNKDKQNRLLGSKSI